MEELKKMLENVIEKLDKNTSEISTLKEIAKRESKWDKERQKYMEKIDIWEERVENLEKEKRKNNVIIKGARITQVPLAKGVENFVAQELKIEAKVIEAYKVGKWMQ